MGCDQKKIIKSTIKSKSKFTISSDTDKTIKLKKVLLKDVPFFIKKEIEIFVKKKEEKQSYIEFGNYLFNILSDSITINTDNLLKEILRLIRVFNYQMFVTILLNLDKIDFIKKIFFTLGDLKKDKYVNSVRPTQFQTELICKKKLTHHEFISNYKEALFFSRTDVEIKDLEERCRKLVDMCFSQNKFHIVFLDGHGRTLYFLLDFIRKKYQEEKIEKQFTLEIIEVDKTAHKFHELFFPDSDEIIKIKCKHDNIFRHIYNKDAIYYFNFCGLKEVVNTVFNSNAFHEIKSFMEKNKNKNMLSFSVLHGNNKDEYNYFKSNSECFSDHRHDYKTFVI